MPMPAEAPRARLGRAQMDRVIDRKLNTADEAHEEAVRVRASGDTPHLRRCLACEKPFESEGWHNRLCPQCRKR